MNTRPSLPALMLLLLALALGCTAQTNFQEDVIPTSAGDLTITLGDEESFRIEAEENLMEYFDTVVSGGRLNIETRPNVRLQPTQPVNYYLTVKELGAIGISSSGDIQAPDLEAARFTITISSSGNLEMGDLQVDELKVSISSSGDVTMGELNLLRR